MRNDYLRAARKVVTDPYILVNLISLRVKQLRQGSHPLVESLERLSLEDTAMREIAEGKISYELADTDSQQDSSPSQYRSGFHFSPAITAKRSRVS